MVHVCVPVDIHVAISGLSRCWWKLRMPAGILLQEAGLRCYTERVALTLVSLDKSLRQSSTYKTYINFAPSCGFPKTAPLQPALTSSSTQRFLHECTQQRYCCYHRLIWLNNESTSRRLQEPSCNGFCQSIMMLISVFPCHGPQLVVLCFCLPAVVTLLRNILH